MTRSIRQYALLLTSTLIFALLASGQQVITSGPPPEIRSHIHALLEALNSGSSNNWEKMAQEHFTPSQLKRHSVEERKQLFDNLRRDFGTISPGMVDGPDEPLRLHIKGSTGATGVIELRLEQGAPYRIEGLGVNIGGSDQDQPRSNVDLRP